MDSDSNETDRATGFIAGAFIGDALGFDPRWCYDLDEMRRDFGPRIDGYTTPPPSRKFHAGMKAGEFSQDGTIMLMSLRSVAERGTYDEELLPRLSADPFSGPGGDTNHFFREVWQARVIEKKSRAETGVSLASAAPLCVPVGSGFPASRRSIHT